MGEARRAAKRWSVVPHVRRIAYERSALDADIATLDLQPVSYLIAYEQHWPLEKVDAIEFEYRCFLQLVRDYPDKGIVPSRDCDTYWHAHILTLALYLDQCQALFGRPLLHYPFSGLLGAEDRIRQQRRSGRSRRLLSELMNRVRRTYDCDHQGGMYEQSIPEVPQPGRYASAVQGA